MGLAETVRKAVATANRTTKDLQVTVQHASWDGTTMDEFGKPKLGAPVARKALAERRQKIVKTTLDQVAQAQAYVAFLEPVTITAFDQIVLPDGLTGPILNFTGFYDGGTGQPYFAEVWLG
jgi:hypothetical protein